MTTKLHRAYTILYIACALSLAFHSCGKENELPRPTPNTEQPIPKPSNDTGDKDSARDEVREEDKPSDTPTDAPTSDPNNGGGVSDKPTDMPTDSPAPNPNEESGEKPNDPTDSPTDNPTDTPTPDPDNGGGASDQPTDTPSPSPEPQPWRAEARRGQTWWMQGVNTGISSSSSWRYAFGEVRALEWEAGMGWYDLNKFDAHRGGTDSDLCWAAVCANVIQWWIDQNKAYIDRYGKAVPSGFSKAWTKEGEEGEGFYHSQIFELYRQHFTNKGGDLKASIEWFFNGMYANRPLSGAGFFADLLGNGLRPVTQIGTSAQTFSDDVAEALKRGEGLSCSLEYPSGYLHALSIWGADFDEVGQLTHIYLTDSNDRNLVTDNRNNKRETKVGLLRRAIKLDTATGKVLQEGGTAGTFNFRIIHLYKLPLYQDRWEAYFSGHR